MIHFQFVISFSPLKLIVFLISSITGIKLIIISISDGEAINESCSEEANSKIFKAKVSKLKGLSISVAGRSFTISTKTNIKEVINVVFIIGICIFLNIVKLDKPKD